METASFPLKQPDPLGNVLSGEISKTTVNRPEVIANTPAQKLLPGKTKVKKKMRVEDIITNLTKKVQQVAPPIEDVNSVSAKENEKTQQVGSAATKENRGTATKGNGNTATKVNGSAATKENDLSSSGEPQEEEGSSFASMCTIRDDPPEYTDLSELSPAAKESVVQSSVLQDKKTSQGNVAPKIVQATPNPAHPVRQVILQTIPQKPNQQTPIILNKLPPGFIIRSDLPSSSFPNLQATSTAGQPKLLLITKSGGPFYLAQNVNTTTSQTQAKAGNKPNTSPVSTQTKTVTGSSASSVLLNGKPMNSNKSILKLTSPSKTSTDTPLITVQYNLPYPNNNCKVVNNPARVAQSSQPLGNLPGTNKVLVTGLPRPSRPREMVVNFAGNQTAHITTMADESSVPPQRQAKFIPSFVFGPSPDTAAIKKTNLSPEKRNDKTIFIVTSPSAAVNSKINTNKKVNVQNMQRKSIYDEKIAKLTGKITNINEAAEANGKAKTLSNVHEKKSNVLVNNVRVSNRKRQQTERAKLFEKETRKRKRSEDKSPVKDNSEFALKIKVEEPDDTTSPMAVSPSKQGTPPSPSKKSKTVLQQQTSVENAPEKKEDDPDSLFRDPALLTREERALQRALMMFKELEEKQARKESVSENEKTSSRKSGKTVQVNKSSDVQRKRKLSNESKSECPDIDVITLKQRKREMKSPSIQEKAKKVEKQNANQEKKDVNQEMKDVNQEKKDVNREKKDVNQEKKDVNLEKKDVNLEKKDVNQEKKDVNLEKKDVNREKKDVNQEKKDVNQEKKDVNQEKKDVNEEKKDVNQEKKDVNQEKKDVNQGNKDSEVIVKTFKQETNLTPDTSDTISVHSNEKRKEIRKKVTVPKKTEVKPDTIKDSPSSTKEHKHLKSVKDASQSPKFAKPLPAKIPDSVSERHRVKTYMLVPSYHGFKDFSPIVLGSRTRSRKSEPVPAEKGTTEDELPVTKPAEKSEKDVALLVVETVGNKAVKQDVVAKDEQLRDLVKNSLRKQGMLKQELELNEKNEDAEQFENREKRNLTINRNTGETVLHKASRMGYDETVYHCIQQGSDSNAKDNAGWTPLHEACSRGHSDVVRVLVKYNADVNACSNDGIRPIHDAADNGKTDSLRLLIAYGADPFISTYSGRSVIDCAKRTEAKDYIKACIGDLYLNDERNDIARVDYENRWDFHGSTCILDKDRKYLGDIFDNVPQQQSGNSMEFEWSETPHLQTYSLPLIKDGIALGRKNYILFRDLQEALNKPRQNVIRLLKRTKIREISVTEFTKEVSSSYFNKRNECQPGVEEGKIELVPLNWTVRSLLKIKCEHLAL